MSIESRKDRVLGNALRLLLAFSLVVASAGAETRRGLPPEDELYRTIATLDAAVFDAFNHCELEKFGSFFVERVEFYHDNGGLTDSSRASLVESVKNNICGKVSRELVEGTLEVYPMHGYGALEIGTHRFHHPGHDDTEPVGEAQFIHLWQNDNGTWRIARVISFDHHALSK